MNFKKQKLVEVGYDRKSAVKYAQKWAFERNPRFINFDNYGGDCTNFVSQCIYAGCGVMNFTPTFGWFFINYLKYAPAWTGVIYLYNFLISNNNVGPYGKVVERNQVEIGDIIQLQNKMGEYHHSLIITSIRNGELYVASHSMDSFNRTLLSYSYHNLRYIHIEGARK
ncbi:MAG: amidase domain-containing protein [Clostridia bacterium]|nr:amidase domain-containing protein [Clostridia bacterium]